MPGISADAAPFVPSWLKNQAGGTTTPPAATGPPGMDESPSRHLRSEAREWRPPTDGPAHPVTEPPPSYQAGPPGPGGGAGHNPLFYDTGRMIRPHDQPHFFNPSYAPPLPTIQVGRVGTMPNTTVRAATQQFYQRQQQHIEGRGGGVGPTGPPPPPQFVPGGGVGPHSQPAYQQGQPPPFAPPAHTHVQPVTTSHFHPQQQTQQQFYPSDESAGHATGDYTQYVQGPPAYNASATAAQQPPTPPREVPQPAGLAPASTEEANIMAAISKLPRPVVMLVVGGRGSGKSTQSTAIAVKYGFLHLSSGDLVRNGQNPLEVLEEALMYVQAELIKAHKASPAKTRAAGQVPPASPSGTSTPPEQSEHAPHKYASARRGIVLDRYMNNAEADPYYLLELLHRYNLQLDLVVNLMMSYEAAVARAEERDLAAAAAGVAESPSAASPNEQAEAAAIAGKPRKDQRRLLEHLTVWRSCNDVYEPYGGLVCFDVEGLSIEEVEYQVHLRVDRAIIGVKAGAAGARRTMPAAPTMCPGLTMCLRYEQFHDARLNTHAALGTPETKRNAFPGSLMTGLIDHESIKRLQRSLKDYYVTWKADGSRLVIVRHVEYGFLAFTAKFSHFYFIDPKLVPSHWHELPTGFEQATDADEARPSVTHIFDAELVQNNAGRWKIFLFDVLYAARTPTSDAPMLGAKAFWEDRYAYLKGLCMGLSDPWSYFCLKHFAPCGEIRALVQSVPSFPTDGIVFQPGKGTYRVPLDKSIYKWKPQAQCSVDYRLSNGIEIDNKRWLFYPLVLKVDKNGADEAGFKNAIVAVPSELVVKEDLSDGAVVECIKVGRGLQYDGYEYEEWEFLRSRPDKAFPNYDFVANQIDLMDHMTQPEVVTFCELYCGTGPLSGNAPSHAPATAAAHVHHNPHQQQQQRTSGGALASPTPQEAPSVGDSRGASRGTSSKASPAGPTSRSAGSPHGTAEGRPHPSSGAAVSRSGATGTSSTGRQGDREKDAAQTGASNLPPRSGNAWVAGSANLREGLMGSAGSSKPQSESQSVSNASHARGGRGGYAAHDDSGGRGGRGGRGSRGAR
jgi:hypothetical protein